jgi:hypothetical protein
MEEVEIDAWHTSRHALLLADERGSARGRQRERSGVVTRAQRWSYDFEGPLAILLR